MEIDISQELSRFEKHISDSDNSRIFFSGIFGIGKTYFLNDFFKDNESYESIFLRPVNYSIASNEDIIDYIKYDIAFELLGKGLEKGLEFEKSSISNYLASEYYIRENPLEVISILAKMSGKIGKPISNIVNGFKELKENIEKYKAEVEIDQKQELITFLEEHTEKEGSIYHENRFTELIALLIRSLKLEEGESKKETVLIIDDLDRLDPEHIFRILNVFACHFDLGRSDENKFGFDKIIVVGDAENIRNIFHAKYGINTDFNGYIDKFFSTEIYNYDNKSVLKGHLSEYLPKLKVGQALHLGSSRSIYYILLQTILRDLIDYDLLNLRTMKTSFEKHHNLEHFSFIVGSNFKSLSSDEVVMIRLFGLLKSIYGSITALDLALEKLSKRRPFRSIDSDILEPVLCLLDCKKHKGESKKETHTFKNNLLNIKIEYSLDKSNYLLNLRIKKISYLDDPEKEMEIFPFAPFLYLTFQEYLGIEKFEY